LHFSDFVLFSAERHFPLEVSQGPAQSTPATLKSSPANANIDVRACVHLTFSRDGSFQIATRLQGEPQ